MSVRVSIIIPVYNVELYIEDCLQSVYNQTTRDNIECIIVDDKGNDQSISIAERFILVNNSKSNINFKIIYRNTNGGLSAARNSGIKEATGEYIYLLDSDDYIIPTCIETLLNIADKYNGVDLLPALYIRDNNDMAQFGIDSFPEYSDNRSTIKRSLLDYDKIPVTAANRLIRKTLFSEQNLWFKEGIIHEDNYWTFFLAKHVTRMAFCPEKLYYYRVTPGSITKKLNKDKEFFAYKTMITDFCNHIDSFEKGAQKRWILLHYLIIIKNNYLNSNKELQNIKLKLLNSFTPFEQIFVLIIFNTDVNSWIHKKSLNIIQRLL